MELSPDLAYDERLFEALARLADCLDSELIAAKGPDRCWHGLWPGADTPPLGILDCSKGNCGVSWVQVVAKYPSSTFPIPDEVTSARCSGPMAMEVTLGVARCAPMPKDREAYVNPQATFDAVRLEMSDERAMRRALLCCLPDLARSVPSLRGTIVGLGTWTPQPVEGRAVVRTLQGFIG